jgi:hypothetical protein
MMPAAVVPASDVVIEAIAGIEKKRLEMEKEAGRVASCSSALRRLHGLLEKEQEAAHSRGPDAGHPPGNVQAVTLEIERVKKMAVITGQGPHARRADPAGLRQATRQKSWQDARRNPARNKGRRTMGRSGGR